MDRGGRLPALGQLDHEAGEFWVENPFLMPKRGDNLSAYEHNCLFLNTSQPGNLSFLDASCNRSGIGCRITVDIGTTRLVRDVFPASGFMGTGPIEQNIGLGPATRITRLQVRWPDGTNQEVHDLPVDRRHQVTRGTAALRSLPLEKSTGPVSSP
jgi:hypothetical protein